MPNNYCCKICNSPLKDKAYLSLTKYRNPEIIPIEKIIEAIKEEDFVCGNKNCQIEIARILSEGYRDRDAFLLPLKKETLDSHPFFSELEKKILKEIICDYNSYKASLR